MIEAPETPHHHPHAGIPWFDIVTGVAILCISVASLLTSLQSEKSMHALVEQNTRLVDAQSTPLLMLDSGNLDEHTNRYALWLTINNVGTGPAQIAWFHATDAEGNNFTSNAIGHSVLAVQPKPPFTSEVINSTMLRSGDKRLVFAWPKPANNPAASALWDNLNRARFDLHASACYCSIFDECKITEFGSSRPRPVASCTQDQDVPKK